MRPYCSKLASLAQNKTDTIADFGFVSVFIALDSHSC